MSDEHCVELVPEDNNPLASTPEKVPTSDVASEVKKEDDVQENNPFAYLERDFSSEKFKIEIKNLPKFYGIGEFRKLLNDKLKLNVNKLKTPKRNSLYAFACFRNEEDREKAINILKDFKWKGKTLQAVPAKPAPDPLVKKRKDVQDAQGEQDTKKQKLLNPEEMLKNSSIPLWNVPYEQQLIQKQENVKKILQRLGNSLGHGSSEIKEWLTKQMEKFDGLPCELLNIRHSDHIDGYRNKCEFTVGINDGDGLRTVGFRIGSYVNGITGVAPIDDLKHVPDSMKTCVKLFQDFVRSSNLEVFNPEVQTGHFRQLTLRTAKNQLMAIVGIHPQSLTETELDQFKQDLVTFFSKGPGKNAHVTSLYYEHIMKKAFGESQLPAEYLWGETHIYETLLGLKFRVSPEAFFQINSSAAEVLYTAAIELANVTETSTVLDVCCGTGTIGLCFAKKCNQVLGLEVIPQAIVDAKENATFNNITNSEFFTGKAEDILGSVCYRSKNDEVIAVVDPPRAGLHQKAILQLRKIKKIQKLVYVSCNPNAALKNFVDLGRPESKTLHGEAFVPIKAVAVDMFPHTRHCELIIYFERWDVAFKR